MGSFLAAKARSAADAATKSPMAPESRRGAERAERKKFRHKCAILRKPRQRRNDGKKLLCDFALSSAGEKSGE